MQSTKTIIALVVQPLVALIVSVISAQESDHAKKEIVEEMKGSQGQARGSEHREHGAPVPRCGLTNGVAGCAR